MDKKSHETFFLRFKKYLSQTQFDLQTFYHMFLFRIGTETAIKCQSFNKKYFSTRSCNIPLCTCTFVHMIVYLKHVALWKYIIEQKMFIPMTGNLKKKNYKIKISFRCNACPFISFKYLVFLNVQNV